MTQEPSPLNTSPRGRAAGLMLATAAVIVVFAVIALLNPSLGGQPRGVTAWAGAAIFAVVLLAVWARTRILRAPRQPDSITAGPVVARRAVALAVIAAVLWLMAGLFWFFAAAGISLRYGMDPVLFAVPLTIYPLLLLGARKLQSTDRSKVEGQ